MRMAAVPPGSQLPGEPGDILEYAPKDRINPISLPVGNLTNSLNEKFKIAAQGASDSRFVLCWGDECKHLLVLSCWKSFRSMIQRRDTKTFDIPVENRIYEREDSLQVDRAAESLCQELANVIVEAPLIGSPL